MENTSSTIGVMKNAIVMGVFGLGYVSLRAALTRRPVFSGRVSERTDLISWNETLMDCIQQLSQVANEDEITYILESVTQIRDASQSKERGSLLKLQRLISSTLAAFTRASGRVRSEMSLDKIRIQNSLVEDIIPVVEEVFEGIQHNHMLDTLGP